MKKLLFLILLFACFFSDAQAQQIVTPHAGWIYSCGGNRQVKRASISGATSGNNTLVSAVTGKKIRVIEFAVVAAGAVTVAFESAADGTALTGDMSFAANGGIMAPYNPHGHFETVAAQLLNMELNGAVQVSGWLLYVEC